ncbi:MAG: threonine/homoserine/homoserine lactone efflux protein [Yoonia sp.]|jgi:threonine/homoserine/homoserine lactone efflux protein
MSQHTIRSVEDYADAFVTTQGVFLLTASWVVAAAFGYLWVAMTTYGLDHVFKWIGRLCGD